MSSSAAAFLVNDANVQSSDLEPGKYEGVCFQSSDGIGTHSACNYALCASLLCVTDFATYLQVVLSFGSVQ